MNFLFLLVLLTPSLAADLDPEPRRQNIVTKFLGKVLDQVFERLSTEGVSVPLLDLAEAGNFSNVKANTTGLTKYLDGVGSHGFQMRLNVSKAEVCGNYHLVHLDVPGLFPFSGKGDFRIEADTINVGMTLKALKNFTTDKFDFNLTEFSVGVQSSKVKFDNLMDDPHVADFLNELLSNLLPQLVAAMAELSSNYLLPTLIDVYGNGIFNCLTADDIVQCIKDLFNQRQTPFLELLLKLPIDERNL